MSTRTTAGFCVQGDCEARRSSRAAFTLLELAVYVALLGVVLGAVGALARSASRVSKDQDAMSAVLLKNRIALRHLAAELPTAIASSVALSNAGKTISFQLPGVFNGVQVNPGDSIRYELVPSTLDPANGLDDNKNGVADEGLLQHVNATSNVVIEVAGNIDLNASAFVAGADGIEATVSTVGASGSAGESFRLTRTMLVRPSN